MTSFPCTGCGTCCHKIGAVLAAYREAPESFGPMEQAALDAFPFEAREDGRCAQLGEDDRCAVYGDRPLVCQVDRMGEARGWSRERTWLMNALACDAMQDAAGVPQARRMLPVVVAALADGTA